MLANLNTATHPDEIDSNALKSLFLKEFEEKPNVYRLSKELGINRVTVYEWIEKDVDFKREFDRIRGIQVQGIEGNLFSQALHNEKAITAQIFALKAWKPEIYGDKFDANSNITLSIDFSNMAKGLLETLSKAKQVGSAEVIEAKELK